MAILDAAHELIASRVTEPYGDAAIVQFFTHAEELTGRAGYDPTVQKLVVGDVRALQEMALRRLEKWSQDPRPAAALTRVYENDSDVHCPIVFHTPFSAEVMLRSAGVLAENERLANRIAAIRSASEVLARHGGLSPEQANAMKGVSGTPWFDDAKGQSEINFAPNAPRFNFVLELQNFGLHQNPGQETPRYGGRFSMGRMILSDFFKVARPNG